MCTEAGYRRGKQTSDEDVGRSEKVCVYVCCARLANRLQIPYKILTVVIVFLPPLLPSSPSFLVTARQPAVPAKTLVAATAAVIQVARLPVCVVCVRITLPCPIPCCCCLLRAMPWCASRCPAFPSIPSLISVRVRLCLPCVLLQSAGPFLSFPSSTFSLSLASFPNFVPPCFRLLCFGTSSLGTFFLLHSHMALHYHDRDFASAAGSRT